ncbi:MAG: rhomboid family intramembrane serine protease [Victivallales bacterium]|nr:rhomboid family intramembrane serine protease [Victivallales bacterium]
MKKVHFENIAIVACLVVAALLLTASPELGEKLRLHADSGGLLLVVQLYTCHLVHWTAAHLFYDALCLAVLGLLLSRRELLLTLLLSAPIVAITSLWLHPELTSYCGLSGVNCALFAYYAVKIGRERTLLGAIALAAILLKTGMEIHSGHTFFATDGFIPVHSAHLVGIMAGVLCGVLEACSLKRSFITSKITGMC